MKHARILYYVETRQLGEENYDALNNWDMLEGDEKEDEWSHVAGPFTSRDEAYGELERIKEIIDRDAYNLRVRKEDLFEEFNKENDFSPLEDALVSAFEELESLSQSRELYAYPYLLAYFQKNNIVSFLDEMINGNDLEHLSLYWKDFNQRIQDRSTDFILVRISPIDFSSL